MTLLVYKNGLLSADTGCTRGETRESFIKIHRFSGKRGDFTLYVAHAGEVPSIVRHRVILQQMIDDGASLTDLAVAEYPPLNCSGIIVAVKHASSGNEIRSYAFNCNTAGQSMEAAAMDMGVWVKWNDTIIEGNDVAVAQALAIDHVLGCTAPEIIKAVSEINSACDIKEGILTYDVFTGEEVTLEYDNA